MTSTVVGSQVRSVACRRRRAATLIVCTALSLGRVASVQGQLPYTTTTFVHGFNDNSDRWLHKDSPGLLASQNVLLGTSPNGVWHAPSLGGTLPISVQAGTLRNVVLDPYASDGHVLIGHSAGGLTIRRAYFTNPASISGMITVNTPHGGAIIAANAARASGEAVNAVVGLFSDFISTIINIVRRPSLGFALEFSSGIGIVGAIIGAVFTYLAEQLLVAVLKPYIDQMFGVNAPVIGDLKPGSYNISNLQSQADAVPHANVVSTISKKDAMIRVGLSALYRDEEFGTWVHRKNAARSAAKLCAHIGYNWIIKTSWGKVCHKVANGLGSIDDFWVRQTLNGDYSLAFDGLLPNRDEQYPGMSPYDSRYFRVDGPNHMNIQYDSRGVTAIAGAMFSIGMRQAAPPPPPPPPPPPDRPCGYQIMC